MTDQQTEKPKEVKGPRFLGKWDYIGSTILALLSTAGDHIHLLSVEGISYLIGRFIAVLLVWALIKMLIERIRRKPAN
jgi:hypothetical protein